MSWPRGFTLIEVVVALAVVATALYAATGSVRAAARGSGHLQQTTLAHWAALNVLNEIKLAPGTAERNLPAQTVVLYGHKFAVAAQLQQGEAEQAKRITLSVVAATAPDEILYTLEAAAP